MITVDVQSAFDLMLAVFGVCAPIALIWNVLGRVFRGFVDMVSGRDNIRL